MDLSKLVISAFARSKYSFSLASSSLQTSTYSLQTSRGGLPSLATVIPVIQPLDSRTKENMSGLICKIFDAYILIFGERDTPKCASSMWQFSCAKTDFIASSDGSIGTSFHVSGSSPMNIESGSKTLPVM